MQLKGLKSFCFCLCGWWILAESMTLVVPPSYPAGMMIKKSQYLMCCGHHSGRKRVTSCRSAGEDEKMKGSSGGRQKDEWLRVRLLIYFSCAALSWTVSTGWDPPTPRGLPTHLSGWMSVQFPRLSHQRLLQIQETAECLWQVPGEQSDLWLVANQRLCVVRFHPFTL